MKKTHVYVLDEYGFVTGEKRNTFAAPRSNQIPPGVHTRSMNPIKAKLDKPDSDRMVPKQPAVTRHMPNRSKPSPELSRPVRHNRIDLVKCPNCMASVRPDRLEKHIQTKCPQRTNPTPQSDQFESSRVKTAKHKNGISHVNQTAEEIRIGKESLWQSSDESSYGDKYLGHMQREWDGKFGSLPLYDDYGDEADAD
jgi:hypothetical protein